MSSAKSKNLTGSYSCIQALYWMYFAAIMSFSGFFLLGGGFSNTQIGIIAAVAGIMSALLQPVLAGYADRPDPIPQKDHPDSLCHPAASRNRAVFFQNAYPDRTSLRDQHRTAAAYDSFHQRARHGEHQPGSEAELRTCAWNGLCRLCSHLLCTRDHHRQSRRAFHPSFRDDHHRPVTWLPDHLSFRQDTEICPDIIRQQKPGKPSSVFPEIQTFFTGTDWLYFYLPQSCAPE